MDAVGVARTPLAPNGMVFLQGELWTASSGSGAPIEAGTHVRVSEVHGLRLVVEPTTAPAPRADATRPRGEGVLPITNGVEQVQHAPRA
jgi:hypothetical protein